MLVGAPLLVGRTPLMVWGSVVIGGSLVVWGSRLLVGRTLLETAAPVAAAPEVAELLAATATPGESAALPSPVPISISVTPSIAVASVIPVLPGDVASTDVSSMTAKLTVPGQPAKQTRTQACQALG